MKRYKIVFQIVLAIGMIVVGALHFTSPTGFERIIPDYLPYHLALVYTSGLLEVLGGVGLLIPRVSRYAAWLIVVQYTLLFFQPIYIRQ